MKANQTINKSKQQRPKSHDRKNIKTNESGERSKNLKQKRIKNLKEFILAEHLKNSRTQKTPKETKRQQQGLLSNLKRRVQQSKVNEPRPFAIDNKNEVSGASGKQMKKFSNLEDILSTDIQIKNNNTLQNVKLLNDEQNSTVKENQIQVKKDINDNENRVNQQQNDNKIQMFQEESDKQLANLIINYQESLDTFIKNQNEELIQEDEGINIQYIEKLLDFFDQLANKDARFQKVFEKIQVSVGLMVHKAIEQIIELRQIVMDLSKQVDNIDEIKLQTIQLEAKYEKEKQQSQKFEKYKEYLQKFISPDQSSLDAFKIIEENQKLRVLLIKQKKNVCEMMEKEQKVMKLLYAIRQQGVDIESIYKECITPEASTSNNSKIGSRKVELHESNIEFEKDLIISANMNKNQFKKQKQDDYQENEKDSMDSESEEADFLFYQYEDCNKDKHQAHANQQMKLNLQSVQTNNQQGFHEEFMANINEWSESWRLAAGKEKKF